MNVTTVTNVTTTTTAVIATTTPPVGGVVPIFDDGQKAFYALFCLVYALVSYGMYRWAKRPFDRQKPFSYQKGIQWIYNVMIGCIFGVFICVTIPHAMTRAELGSNPAYTVYAVAAFGVTLGFLVMFVLQECKRVYHSNPNYAQPPHVTENLQPLLDSEKVTANDHLVVEGRFENFYGDYTDGMDREKDKIRRRIFSIPLYCVLLYVTVMDGFFLVFWSNKTLAGPWPMLAMSWVIRLAYSVIVSGLLIHGTFHTFNHKQWHEYLYDYRAFSVVYFVTLVLSAMPMYLNMTVNEAAFIIQRIPFTLFYGITSGVFLWYLAYVLWIQDPEPSRGDAKRKIASVIFISLLIAIAGLFI
jgi:hypothetical protein